MPISIASFAAEVIDLTISTSQGDLALRYRPNAMTPTLEAALQETGGQGQSFLELFCELVEWLDIEGPLYDESDRDHEGHPRQIIGEGDPIPIEPATVALLPSRVLGKVIEAIMADMTGEADGPKLGAPNRHERRSRNGSLSR